MEQQTGVVAGGGQKLLEVRHVGDPIFGETALAGAEHLTAAAQLEVLLSDEEAVLRLAHNLQALLGAFPKGRLVKQHAVRLALAASNAPAKLMKLGEAKSLRMLDGHDGRIGNVDADLDDSRRDEHAQLAFGEGGHGRILHPARHGAVQQTDSAAEHLAEVFMALLGGRKLRGAVALDE